jgi:hypothetical protein
VRPAPGDGPPLRALRLTSGAPGRLWLALGVLAAALGVLVAVLVGTRGGSSVSPSRSPAQLAGELTGPAPWPRNVGDLGARLQSLGLPALAQEGTSLHTHQHLDLYVDGRRVTVPAGIGIDESNRFISPLHTHDESGVIHVESPDVRQFTLGQFFAVWGVRLTPSCLGGYCAAGAKRLWLFVDGRRVSTDPRRLLLTEHEEILLAYGTQAQLPSPVPARYRFAPGL